jgi:uncharacterized protein (DUF1697 family)
MPVHVALLRGVNVGRAKRVPMAELRAVLEGLGLDRVATLLNSGNAVFRATGMKPDALARSIGAALLDRFGFEVPVVVKPARELADIARENTLAPQAADHHRLLVVFAQDKGALAKLSWLEALVTPPERLLMGRHAAYLECPGGILDSRAGTALLGQAGQAVTTRNWATVLKLQALAAGCGD